MRRLDWVSATAEDIAEGVALMPADEQAEVLRNVGALLLRYPTQIEFLAAELVRPEYAATRAVLARLAGKEPPHAE